MRRLVLFCFAFGLQWAQAQTLTLENIWSQRWFSPQRVPGFQAMANGTSYAIIDQNQIKAFDFIRKESQGTAPLALRQWQFTHNDKPVSFSAYTFSPTEQWVILTEEEEAIYRYSTKGKYWIGNAGTGKAWPWMDTALIQYPDISPDEKWMSFVLNNNLFIKEIPNGNLRQITFDGKSNAVINGASDWVYEEEFETVKAYQWSTDGRYLAFLRFDEAHVESVTMEYFFPNHFSEEEADGPVGYVFLVEVGWVFRHVFLKSVKKFGYAEAGLGRNGMNGNVRKAFADDLGECMQLFLRNQV